MGPFGHGVSLAHVRMGNLWAAPPAYRERRKEIVKRLHHLAEDHGALDDVQRGAQGERERHSQREVGGLRQRHHAHAAMLAQRGVEGHDADSRGLREGGQIGVRPEVRAAVRMA